MRKLLFTLVISVFCCLSARAQVDVASLQARIDSLVAENQTLKMENAKLRQELDAFKNGERQVCPEDELDVTIAEGTLNASQEDTAFFYPQNAQFPTQDVAPMETALAPTGDGDDSANDALRQLKASTDDATGITTYEYSKGLFSDGNQCAIYLTQRGADVDVHLNVVYTDNHPLSFSAVSLSFDGSTIDVPFTSDDKSRKTSGSPKSKKYREELDVKVDAATVAFLKRMTAASKAELRLTGNTTVKRQLSKRELRSFNIVLSAYDQLVSGQ